METRSALLALVREIHRLPMDSPPNRPVAQSFDDSLMNAWTNGWTNSEFANDLTHHDDHVTSLSWHNVTLVSEKQINQ